MNQARNQLIHTAEVNKPDVMISVWLYNYTRTLLVKKHHTRQIYMFWSAPVSAWSWQREGCRWDTAGLSWGSRCSPCSAGLHRCGEPGSTSGWAALERRGPSGASQCRHHCLSLDTQKQHHYHNLNECFFQVKDASNYLYKCYIANASMYWHITLTPGNCSHCYQSKQL